MNAEIGQLFSTLDPRLPQHRKTSLQEMNNVAIVFYNTVSEPGLWPRWVLPFLSRYFRKSFEQSEQLHSLRDFSEHSISNYINDCSTNLFRKSYKEGLIHNNHETFTHENTERYADVTKPATCPL